MTSPLGDVPRFKATCCWTKDDTSLLQLEWRADSLTSLSLGRRRYSPCTKCWFRKLQAGTYHSFSNRQTAYIFLAESPRIVLNCYLRSSFSSSTVIVCCLEVDFPAYCAPFDQVYDLHRGVLLFLLQWPTAFFFSRMSAAS